MIAVTQQTFSSNELCAERLSHSHRQGICVSRFVAGSGDGDRRPAEPLPKLYQLPSVSTELFKSVVFHVPFVSCRGTNRT
jgi:hypothetical protein